MTTPAEIAESLTIEDIPIKLRCASCNKLAQEAVRLPCCDQNICAECQADKLGTCPICYHEPVNAEDCKANKALRQTIKIFLKKKIIDRENAAKKQIKELKATTPSSTGTPVETVEQPQAPAQETISISTPTGQNKEQNCQPDEVGNEGPALQSEIDGVASEPATASGELVAPDVIPAGQNDNPGANEPEVGDNDVEEKQASGENPGAAPGAGANSFASNNQNGTTPNMGFNRMSDMGQMMQFMPNGMPNPMMPGFPNLMGMPGMGMDPMAMSQGMFEGFGGPGMMNMGMGFDPTQGAFGGGFNEQQASWMAGNQDNFMQNTYGAASNFGANAGYGPGYNMSQHQGNFNQMHQHQQPPFAHNRDFNQQHGFYNQGFGRGRGRGRGAFPYAGRGRGGFNQSHNGPVTNNASFNAQQGNEGPLRRDSPDYGEKREIVEDTQAVTNEFDPGDAEDRELDNVDAEKDDRDQQDSNADPATAVHKDPDVLDDVSQVPQAQPQDDNERDPPTETQAHESSSEPLNDQSLENPHRDPPANSFSVPVPTGPASNTAPFGRGAGRGSYRGASELRGGLHTRGFTRIPNDEAHGSSSAIKAYPTSTSNEGRGQGVVGAPTGPKAMRQNSSQGNHQVDAGFSIVGRAAVASRGEEALRSPLPALSTSHSPSRRRSSSGRDGNRRRSRSPSGDRESGRYRDRHAKRRSSRERSTKDGEDENSRHRTSRRETSIESTSRRSSPRRRPDRGYERDGERDRGSDGRSSRHHRSHRSYRDEEGKNTSEEKDSYKSSRRRSRSREGQEGIKINGASRRSHHSSRHRDRDVEDDAHRSSKHHHVSTSSSRKRRSYEDEEDAEDEDRNGGAAGEHHRKHRRHHKRSKHDDTDNDDAEDDTHRSSRVRHKSTARCRGGQQNPLTELAEEQQPPTGPKKSSSSSSKRLDTHALEREKRDRERQMRELQRRAIAGGGGGGGGRRGSSQREANGDELRINGASGNSGRRMNVRYEDELENFGR